VIRSDSRSENLGQKVIPSERRSEKFAKIDTFRSAIWTLQVVLPRRHVSVAVRAPIGARTAADSCCHSSWLTDDLNPYSISLVTCTVGQVCRLRV